MVAVPPGAAKSGRPENSRGVAHADGQSRDSLCRHPRRNRPAELFGQRIDHLPSPPLVRTRFVRRHHVSGRAGAVDSERASNQELPALAAATSTRAAISVTDRL